MITGRRKRLQRVELAFHGAHHPSVPVILCAGQRMYAARVLVALAKNPIQFVNSGDSAGGWIGLSGNAILPPPEFTESGVSVYSTL